MPKILPAPLFLFMLSPLAFSAPGGVRHYKSLDVPGAVGLPLYPRSLHESL